MPHSVSASSEHFPFLHSSPSRVPPSVDPFTITTSTGFMPLTVPQKDLPSVFKPLNVLLNKLPVVTEGGSPGLLAEYRLGPAVDEHFPDLTAEVVKVLHPLEGKPDLRIVTAIFRDYAFLASAYLLEPCWETWKKKPEDGYGHGRSILPAKIAQPLYKCAEVYAVSHIIYNVPKYHRTDCLQPRHPTVHVLRRRVLPLQLHPCQPSPRNGLLQPPPNPRLRERPRPHQLRSRLRPHPR
jgi:hypothetical protein